MAVTLLLFRSWGSRKRTSQLLDLQVISTREASGRLTKYMKGSEQQPPLLPSTSSSLGKDSFRATYRQLMHGRDDVDCWPRLHIDDGPIGVVHRATHMQQYNGLGC